MKEDDQFKEGFELTIENYNQLNDNAIYSINEIIDGSILREFDKFKVRGKYAKIIIKAILSDDVDKGNLKRKFKISRKPKKSIPTFRKGDNITKMSFNKIKDDVYYDYTVISPKQGTIPLDNKDIGSEIKKRINFMNSIKRVSPYTVLSKFKYIGISKEQHDVDNDILNKSSN